MVFLIQICFEVILFKFQKPFPMHIPWTISSKQSSAQEVRPRQSREKKPMDYNNYILSSGSICLRGTNITVVRDWRVVPYTDRKATIIAMRDVERATNMGCRVESIAFY